MQYTDVHIIIQLPWLSWQSGRLLTDRSPVRAREGALTSFWTATAPLVQWLEFALPKREARVRFPDGAVSTFSMRR